MMAYSFGCELYFRLFAVLIKATVVSGAGYCKILAAALIAATFLRDDFLTSYSVLEWPFLFLALSTLEYRRDR